MSGPTGSKAQRSPFTIWEGKTKSAFLLLACKLIGKLFILGLNHYLLSEAERQMSTITLSQWQVCVLWTLTLQRPRPTATASLGDARREETPLRRWLGMESSGLLLLGCRATLKENPHRKGHKQSWLNGIPLTPHISSLHLILLT